MARRAFARTIRAGLLAAVAAVPLVATESGAAPRVQIVEGARYQFFLPFAPIGTGGNVWTISSEPAGVLTIVRASNGALVRLLSGSRFGFGTQHVLGAQGNDLWMGTPDSRLVELNGATGAVLRSFTLPKNTDTTASSIAFDGGLAWITNYSPALVSEVDLADGKVVRTLPAGNIAPQCVVITQGRMWIYNTGGALNEYVAANGAKVRSIRFVLPPHEPGAYDLAVVGDELWAPLENRVVVLDAVTGARIANLAGRRDQLAGAASIASTRTRVWVANFRGSSVTEFDARSHRLLLVLRGPAYRFLNPSSLTVYDGRVWVASGKQGGTILGWLTAFPAS